MAFQSNVNPAQLTQLGQANLAGDTRALYLKLFSGEMFKGFQNNTIARDLIMKRTLKNGKSLQFIFTGRTKSCVLSVNVLCAICECPVCYQ